MSRHAATYGSRMWRHGIGRSVWRGPSSVRHPEAPPGEAAVWDIQDGARPTATDSAIRHRPVARWDGAYPSGCNGALQPTNTAGQSFWEVSEGATFRGYAGRTNASRVPFHGHGRAGHTIGKGVVRLFSPPFRGPYTAVMAARRARGRTNAPVTTAAARITQPARHPSRRRDVGPAEVIVETVPDPGAAATIARWGEHLARLGRSAGTRRGVDRLQTQPTPRPAAHGRDGGRNA